MGQQWPGMGQRLLADEPGFAAAVADLDPLFRRLAGLPGRAGGLAPGRRAGRRHHPVGRLPVTVPLTTMGLDSLLAVRIRSALQHEFGLAPPMPLLLQGATLTDIGQLIAAHLGLPPPGEPAAVAGVLSEAPADGPVTAPAGSGRTALRVLRKAAGNPVFFFHPGGGDSSVYRQLAGLLGPGVPARGFDRIDGATSIGDRADQYLTRLLRLPRRGPYRLAGWSFGGFLAYEVASRLAAAGHQVELVAMIDSVIPPVASPGIDQADLQHLSGTLERIYGRPVPLPQAEMLAAREERQADLLVQAIAEADVIAPRDAPVILRGQRAFHLDGLAVRRYRPPRYPGRVVLYRVTLPPPRETVFWRVEQPDPALGWSEYCGPGLEVVPVPGHHFSLLDPPQADAIAEHLRAALRAGPAA